jgi:hypothetical protein
MMQKIAYHKHTIPVNIGRWALAEGRHRELLVYLYARAIASVHGGYIEDEKLVLIQKALGWTKRRFDRWFASTVEQGLIERQGQKWHVVAAQKFHANLLSNYFSSKRYAKMKASANLEWYKDLTPTQFKGLLYGWLKAADARRQYGLARCRDKNFAKQEQLVKEYAKDDLNRIAKDRGNASYRYFLNEESEVGLALSTQSRLMKTCVQQGWIWRSFECDPYVDQLKITTHGEMAEFLYKNGLMNAPGFETSRIFKMKEGVYAGQLRILRGVWSRIKTKEVEVFSSKAGLPKVVQYDPDYNAKLSGQKEGAGVFLEDIEGFKRGYDANSLSSSNDPMNLSIIPSYIYTINNSI